MYQVIIIIGLPASGKTFLANKLSYTYKIYDDYINKFYNGELLNDINDNKKVCLNDPRLCDLKIFNRHIKKILKYTTKDKIKLILFENDPDNCIKNSINRNDNKTGIIETIDHLTDLYDLNNYKDFNYEIKKVYCSSISNHPL